MENIAKSNSSTYNDSTGNGNESLSSPQLFIPLDFASKLHYTCIIVVGIVGFFANFLLIMALCYSKKDRKSTANILIVNQSLLDLIACAMLIVRFAIKLRSYYLKDWWGLMLCKLDDNSFLQAMFAHGATAGIVVISLERYFKLVHPIVHRNHGKDWMILVGIASSWIYGFLIASPSSVNAKVINGVCIQLPVGATLALQRAYTMYLLIAVYLGPVGIMAFCYASILYVIRSSGRIGQANQSSGAVNGAAQTSRISNKEMNIVTTMITQAGQLQMARVY